MPSHKIVTTPMCEKILQLAGINDYAVTRHPEMVKEDIVITLSETKIYSKSIKIKLNTFSQINESIKKLSEIFETVPLEYKINNSKYSKCNKNIKIKVYSNFLKEIIEDMGFKVVHENFDYIVYPDYMKDKIRDEIKDNEKAVQIPSHKNVPLDPIERARMRYNILEKSLCTKH